MCAIESHIHPSIHFLLHSGHAWVYPMLLLGRCRVTPWAIHRLVVRPHYRTKQTFTHTYRLEFPNSVTCRFFFLWEEAHVQVIQKDSGPQELGTKTNQFLFIFVNCSDWVGIQPRFFFLSRQTTLMILDHHDEQPEPAHSAESGLWARCRGESSNDWMSMFELFHKIHVAFQHSVAFLSFLTLAFEKHFARHWLVFML